jgi:dextranase
MALILSQALISCGPAPVQSTATPVDTSVPTESSMIKSVNILDIHLDRAFYNPGDPVRLTLQIESQVDEAVPVRLRAVISHLTNVIEEIKNEFTLNECLQTIELSFTPPPEAPRGYGIDLCIETESGTELKCGSAAFDVLQHWTQTPRYGFLTDFFPGRSDASQTMESLTRYHINGLQFYDWMFRHDQFLTDEEPYLDPLGRRLSLETVEDLIAAAHERNIAAMPYTAIYAASIPFYEEHQEWALYQANGQPYLLGENFLVYMDPRPDSPWVEHLLDQFNQVLQQTAFDGVHLDQYGDPKEGYDVNGQRFELAVPLAETINATKELVLLHRPRGAVVFNAVTNWPIETVAPSDQDFVYIEVWSPYNWFDDLHKLITNAQDLSEGKPVVLAAYIDPSLEHNARLIDAVIFASGGGHIELGEGHGILADPYFPKFQIMTPSLAEAMRRYYDFAVRYQDVIGPRTQDSTQNYLHRIEMEGVSTRPSMLTDKVWTIVREGDGFTAINFINLLSVEKPEWTSPVKDPPTPLEATTVKVFDVEREISCIWFASPDLDDPSPQMLEYSQGIEEGKNVLLLQIPSLAYWDLVVIEWNK